MDDRGPLIGALLRRSHQAITDEVDRALAAAGFADLQASSNVVLRALWDHAEGVRATDLAARAKITKQSMGALVDALEDNRYIERVVDPDDGRAKLVRLTRRGREACRVGRAAVRRIEHDWSVRIGADRLAALRGTLVDLLASLDYDA
jgi:DNA-binding MarR family transcriptional regulator